MSQADPAKLLCRLGNLGEAAAAASAAAKALAEVAQAEEEAGDVQAVGDERGVTIKWGQEQVLARARAYPNGPMCGMVPDGLIRAGLHRMGFSRRS